MIRTKVELGTTVRVRWLLKDAGVGVTGAGVRTALIIKRESDGRFYDFDDNTWQVTPTTSYTVLTEDTDLAGSYFHDLDLSTLIDEDVVICHVSCASAPVDVEEFIFNVVFPDEYSAHGVLSHDYVTDITYMAAVALGPDGVETTSTRAWFSVIKASDGTLLLDNEQVTDETNGVFMHNQSTLGLEAHTLYFLVVSVEVGVVSYRNVTSFTTL